MPALPGSRPPGGTGTGAGPPQWWTLAVPCLLTLPVGAWCVLLAAVAGILGCFDTCGPGDGPFDAVAAAEFILAAASAGMLIAGLARPAWRRVLRRFIWIACLLAWAGLGLLYVWAQAHP